jgi:NADH-quinone oxidoreductase subunit M
VIAIIAFLGVVGAAVYALRLFIGSMHNRVGSTVHSLDIGLADLVALVPIVVVILALAFYPQWGLRRSQATVKRTLVPAELQAGTLTAQRVPPGWTAYAPLSNTGP